MTSAPTNAPPSLQQRKAQLVRSAIWDAATDLFAEQGYDETTVDEIAERAGISRRSFFRYFSSKSDLFASGIVEYGSTVAEVIRSCPASAPLPDLVRRTVLQVAQQCSSHPGTRKVMQILAKHPAAREALNSRKSDVRDRVEGALAERRKTLGDLSPAVVTDLMLTMIDVIFHFWASRGGEEIGATVSQVLATLGGMVGEQP